MISYEIDSRSPMANQRMRSIRMLGQILPYTADFYSDYFEVERLHNKTESTIIRLMKSQFARHGIPDRVLSDNGPPF